MNFSTSIRPSFSLSTISVWYLTCQARKQKVSDDLGLFILNLQIVYEKSKSLDHMIKGSCDFMEGSFSLYVTTLSGVVAIGIMVVEIKYF